MKNYSCIYCKDTGYIDVPDNEAAYDREYDRLDNMGQFTGEECHERALKHSGSHKEPCPYCNKK